MSEEAINAADLPASWVLTTLGTVVQYGRTEKAEPHEIADDDWVLELEDVEKDSSRLLQKMTFLERQSKSTKNKFQAGNVLYGKLRPYLNKVLIADEPGYCTTEILPLNAGAHLDNRYLFYWLKHPAFLKYVEAASHGMNMPRLGTEAGKAAPFVLAPRSEQTRIANQLDTLLTRIQSCKDRFDAIPAFLKRFRQAVLRAATTGELTSDWRESERIDAGTAAKEVSARLQEHRSRHASRSKGKFKEPVGPDLSHWQLELPESWSVESVSAFAECLDHLRVPVTKDKRATAERLYPYFGANGQVDMVDDYLFDDELVMVTEDETFYGRVKPIAYRFSGRCWVNNHAHVLLAGDSVRADYLCYSLMHYDVQPWLTGTTGRAKLTQGALNALPLAVPPQTEIVEIVRRVHAMLTLADRIEARTNAARTQAQRLSPLVLAKAFRGELVQQDPQDEPASVLLQRLAATPPAKAKASRGRPRTKTQELFATPEVVQPDAAGLPDSVWAAPEAVDEHAVAVMLVAVLQAWGGPMPQMQARLAAVLCLQPRQMTAALPAEQAAEWQRLVGPAADSLPTQVARLQPATDSAWRKAVLGMRARGDLVEEGSGPQATWALGPGAGQIETAGWPQGRAGWVVEYLRAQGAEAISPLLEPLTVEFVHARAA